MSYCTDCNSNKVCVHVEKCQALEKEVGGMHIDDIITLSVKCKYKNYATYQPKYQPLNRKP